MFNSNLHSNIRLLDSRIQQNYGGSKPDKIIRNGNWSLQRNIINNQQAAGKIENGQLNQSVEADIVMVNSKLSFSPKAIQRLIWANEEVKRNNSSIKFIPEENEEPTPWEGQTNNARIKSGRMWSTLNHFYKKSPMMKKPKQKQSIKSNAYQQENDYSTNEKVAISRAKY